jgi:hypothetical protein
MKSHRLPGAVFIFCVFPVSDKDNSLFARLFPRDIQNGMLESKSDHGRI